MFFVTLGKPLWRKVAEAIVMNFAFTAGEKFASKIVIPYMQSKANKKLKKKIKRMQKEIKKLKKTIDVEEEI